MNEVFIIGKIISKINFKFIVNSKEYFSKARFELQTLDEQKLIVIAYNQNADYVYAHLKKENCILIRGKICTTGEIEICEVENL